MCQDSCCHSDESIHRIRHSMAHIMAAAIQNLYPDVQMGFGPPVENGFYYDFDFGTHVLEMKDFKKIEKEMASLLRKNLPFTREEYSMEQSLEKVDGLKQSYKRIQVENLSKDGVSTFSFYTTGKFIDLCEGPHVDNTSALATAAFKLDRISGAYWLGSEKNKMLTRIYCLCFQNQAELDEYLERRKKAEEFDHKKLGKEMDLFFVSEEIGKGLILWTPNGTILRDEVEKYAKEMEFRYDYKRVATPHITKEQLFLKSGHLPAYKESMFPPMIVTEEGNVKETLYLKPMNCPFHHTIFSNQLRSYRELPLRLAEYGTCYRFEQSGELSGLIRVRCMTMNDAHIYCPEEELENEIKNILGMYQEFYKTFGLSQYTFRLSLGKADSDKFIGDPAQWEKAGNVLKTVLDSMAIKYYIGEGEAAFYGPKIDIQFKNLMGREETVSTIQVDFLAAERFNLSYVSKTSEHKKPVVIHRAPLSTHERFLSFLIEYYGGAFPTWMASTQVCLIPVSEAFQEYCTHLAEEMKKSFIRAECDFGADSFNKKIRTNVKRKIPILLIIGNEEVSQEMVTVRRHGHQEQMKMKRSEFLEILMKEIKDRVRV